MASRISPPGYSAGALLACVLLAYMGPSRAQIHVPVYTGTPLMIAAGVVNQQTLDAALRPLHEREPEATDEPAVPRGSTIAPPQADAQAYAERLAGTYPAEQREAARRLFEELLVGYRTIEGRFGIPRDDLAGAVAAFLAGSYMAYRDTEFPDASFRPLVDQQRAVILGTAAFSAASAREKRETYEQMAILGMFMATTRAALKQRPDPALRSALQNAARGYLEQFLKVDAARVEITAAGLALR